MREILIYGEIGWDVDPKDIVRQFQEAKGEDILLRIHSAGGSVHDGNAIISAINGHDGEVSAQIDGMAFSMAAVIALEVRERLTMPADAWIMFHEVRNNAGGQVDDMERQLEQMRHMNASVAAKLSAAMGISEEDAAGQLKAEIWMTGDEAHAAGIVQSVTPAQALAAHVKGEWANTPDKLLQITAEQPTTKKTNDMKLFKLFTKDNGSAEPSLEVAELDPTDIGAELDNARKDIDQLTATHAAEMTARQEKIDAAESKVAELETEIANRATELEEVTAAHAAKLEAAETSAEEKANAIVAQMGHEQINVIAPDEESVTEKYQKMAPGPERLKFRQDHKEELAKEFGSGALR